MAKGSSSGSAYTISSGSEDEAYEPEASASPPAKRAKSSSTRSRPRSSIKPSKGVSRKSTGRINGSATPGDIEDVGSVLRPHGMEHHGVERVAAVQGDLLDWFESVREKRGMPWRKRYDHGLSMEEKGQRAYEVWVSEIMLQQTQVSTVIAYWKRWIEKWPTIADLAKADVEEVNAMWRGLGYYRRARSLLEGAKTVMGHKKYEGRLPSDPVVLEKEIPGVGRYTAGAICSTAYGARTPLVDGNVHRLLTRLLAIHASQTDGKTIKLLWQAATELVDSLPMNRGQGVAGDWNQALMELGSQVCKPVSPECGACPIRGACNAYSELSAAPPPRKDDPCDICAPIPSSSQTTRIPSVTVFPMRKEKKASREEEEVVCVLECRNGTDRRWLFTKRPEKGLLAGLFEPPSTPLPSPSTIEDRIQAAIDSLPRYLEANDLESKMTSQNHVSSVPHIFSHINMVYHVVHLVFEPGTGDLPDTKASGVWLDAPGVESANVGTGVKKVWSAVYGSWGSFESGKISKPLKRKKAVPAVGVEGKVVRKVMMPMMPFKSKTEAL